ncbi:MarR family winged helix-turn-helix transcriptional regulator [Streptosporangium sp. NBC_01639]|uniref:MarR family winged helix-turn-helix transcriptional regulator n=1 Tax=unclassified Streptosporangium TaxID=2632669 RepID=UPI002DD87234|nr:MarR family winged helix-turn-helix transcriptional regulator [Streptosporangium sp. NBC_01756]WSC90365.1 MarR family winged helix-turn-helix transcriptional regulator [Streptosporangium sp. NBC_01756]WTD58746.1 MarR family winged helix-turn-helix transcriptional regulator [Streptosporangium sp. NBC_01639]
MTSTGTAGWLDDREQRVWEVFFTMQDQFWRQMSRQLRQETGLSEVDFVVLTVLIEAPEGRLRAFELSAVAQMEKSRLHHHLNRMVERGLLTRETCADAPRGAMFTVAEAGRTAFADAAPVRAAHVRHWLIDRLSGDQLAALEEISEVVLAHLRSGEPAPTWDGDCS